jgi:hypothetical protein
MFGNKRGRRWLLKRHTRPFSIPSKVGKKAAKEQPSSVLEWEKAYERADLQGMNINSFREFKSGSKISQSQGLRAIYPEEKLIQDFDPANYDLDQQLSRSLPSGVYLKDETFTRNGFRFVVIKLLVIPS